MEKMTIEQAIEQNGYHLATIVGDSMMPLLRNRRDMVKVVAAKNKLKKYDLPLYRRPGGEYVLHRIVKVKKNYYVICGDNRFSREKVPLEWIVGVAESVFRDEQEVPVTSPEYLRYVKKVCRTFWPRRIKNKITKIQKKKTSRN